jgi:hypothetical protein
MLIRTRIDRPRTLWMRLLTTALLWVVLVAALSAGCRCDRDEVDWGDTDQSGDTEPNRGSGSDSQEQGGGSGEAAEEASGT